MYRLFVKNLKKYIELNEKGLDSNEFRLDIVKPLTGLMDINIFKKWEKDDKQRFEELSNLIYEINNRTEQYHSFKTFSWELWGYGFEGNKSNNFMESRISEQIQLIDLLLGTHYWVV